MEAITVEVNKESLKTTESYKKLVYWFKEAEANAIQTAKENREIKVDIDIFWGGIDELVYWQADTPENRNLTRRVYKWLKNNHEHFVDQNFTEGMLYCLEHCRWVK